MEHINETTGEITPLEYLNKVIIVETMRKNGTIRIQQDFSNCPTMAEQHTAHMTNINWLMERYRPDELAQYLAARNPHRPEITGHDFSEEPNLQEGKNVVYKSQQAFKELPEDIQRQFKNHVEFLKFIDNPQNQEKMIRMGILTKKKIEDLQSMDLIKPKEESKTTTQEEDKTTLKTK